MFHYIIIPFLFYLCVISTSPRFCDGQYCDENCLNCKYTCDPSICLPENNCYCANKKIPGNLPLEKTPQFVLYTLDDAFNDNLMSVINNLDFLLKNPNIRDRNNCSLRVSAYMIHVNSDYPWAKVFEASGGSVNLHTINHNTHIDTNLSTWKNELEQNFKSLTELGWVSNITGARAPFLELNDEYLNQLQEMGIKYESTMTQNLDQNGLLYWPFSLDYGVPERYMCANTGLCPKKPYKGLWEFPMHFWRDKNGNNYDIMYQTITNDSLNDFKKDFDGTYCKNRVPRGFFHHPQYYTVNYDWMTFDGNKASIFTNFYEYISKKPNVLFATESMILEWMKNPLSFEETRKLPMFQCPQKIIKTPADACPITKCSLQDYSQLKICGKSINCPLMQPNPNGGWSKYKGNTNNFNKNNDFLNDSGNNDSTINGSWTGTATIQIRSDWFSGLCGDLSIINPNNKIAYAQIITFKLCNKYIVSKSDSLWGSDQKRTNTIPVKWMKVENWAGTTYKPNIKYDSGGFCLGYNIGFSLNNAFAISVEFYDKNLGCTSETCKPRCGNDVCDEGENETNCAVDCSVC